MIIKQFCSPIASADAKRTCMPWHVTASSNMPGEVLPSGAQTPGSWIQEGSHQHSLSCKPGTWLPHLWMDRSAWRGTSLFPFWCLQPPLWGFSTKSFVGFLLLGLLVFGSPYTHFGVWSFYWSPNFVENINYMCKSQVIWCSG